MYHLFSSQSMRFVVLILLGLVSAGSQADRTISYTYTTQGQVETVDGPRLDVTDVTTYGYDGKGNRNLVRNALGQEAHITAFDGAGRPLTIIDPNGLTTQLTYDPRGRLLNQSVTDGVETRETGYTYDPVGNLIQVSSPGGSVLHYEYDTANRLIGLEDGSGNRIDYSLDAMGNRLETRVSDPSGTLTQQQRQAYNQLGRLTQSINAKEHTTDYAYDANGNLIKTTDARQNPTQQTYDALDRLNQTTDALDGVTRYTYDAQDNLTSLTDPNGLTTQYDYDGLGNLISQTSPDTGTTSYTYDEAGNRLTQTDARGITVSYEYDALNRLTAIHYPDSSLDVSYDYDQGPNGIGRLTRMTDAQGVIDYTYNAFGQLTSRSRTSHDAIVTTFSYAYDANGHLTRMTYPSGQAIHYGYDTQGQLESLSLTKSDGTLQPLVSNVQRLPFGSIQAYDYGNGLKLARSYDQDYRLIAQTIPGILQSSYQHDPVGNISEWLDLLNTGHDQQFGYDQLDRLINASGAYGALGYTYDATGNRLSLSDGASTQAYTYASGSHRLLEILGGTPDTRDYDAAGNTLQSLIGSYSYDASNRMVGFTKSGLKAVYAYNGQGERIRKTVNGIITRYRYAEGGQLLGEYDQSGEAIREYVYLEGQPVALLSAQSEASSIAFDQTPVLSYGGAGQDVAATVDVEGASLTLAGNGWKKIALPYSITPNSVLEFDFASSAQGEIHGIGFDNDDGISSNRSFKLYGSQAWGIRDLAQYNGSGIMHYIIPVGSYYTGEMQWLTFTNDHDISNPTAESWFNNIRVYEAGESGASTEVAYLHTDHLGAVVKATDENQAIIWDAVRKPFGERTVMTAQIEMPLGFPGQYYDEETGNYYNYKRDYDSTTGRYLQSDPIGLAGGFNTYAYVDSNPIMNTDIYGLAKSCFSEDKYRKQAAENYKECLSDNKGYCAVMVGRCSMFYKSPLAMAACVASGGASCVLGACYNRYDGESLLCELNRPVTGYEADDYLVPDDGCCPE